MEYAIHCENAWPYQCKNGHDAILYEHLECLKCFISFIDDKTKLKMLKMIIYNYPSNAFFNVLLKDLRGDYVNKQNKEGNTLLHMLCYNVYEIYPFIMLINKGADPHIKNKEGYSAHDIIKRYLQETRKELNDSVLHSESYEINLKLYNNFTEIYKSFTN